MDSTAFGIRLSIIALSAVPLLFIPGLLATLSSAFPALDWLSIATRLPCLALCLLPPLFIASRVLLVQAGEVNFVQLSENGKTLMLQVPHCAPLCPLRAPHHHDI